MPYTFVCSECRSVVALVPRLAVMASLVIALISAGGCRGGATTPPDESAVLHIAVADADLDADVFVDGNYVGQVRALQQAQAPIQLAVGKHRVEVRKPGRFPVQRTVEVKAGGPATVEVSAELLGDPR